jgi:hypothetical protein
MVAGLRGKYDLRKDTWIDAAGLGSVKISGMSTYGDHHDGINNRM